MLIQSTILAPSPGNHFLEIQANDIRLGAVLESMDLAQELWKIIKPLGARAQGPGQGARAGRGGVGWGRGARALARALGPVLQGA